MTSLFDQFDQPTLKPKSSMTPIRPEMSTTGFIHVKLEEESPMFGRNRVNFAPPDSITHLVVSNNLLILAMANQHLLRIDLRQPEKPEEIDISKNFSNQLKLSGLYLDPSGEHLILVTVSRQQGEIQPYCQLFYLNRRSTKLKQTVKFRGSEVTSVAWSFDMASEASTGPVLLGTSKGAIFETEIKTDGDRIFGNSVEQYCKQVFDIGKQANNVPITGLEFHRIPSTDTYFIIVTTLVRIYEFVESASNPEERPFLSQIFNKYLNKPEQFVDIVSKLKYSKLQFYYAPATGQPTQCAWLVEKGLYYGQVDMNLSDDKVVSEQNLVSFPSMAPISFVLTQFHALLMYADHIKFVSLLNNEVVFEDVINEPLGKLINITKDPLKSTIWAFTEKAVFKYKVTKEDRNVWRIYIEKGKFDLAKKYCGDNPAFMDHVLVRQAEMFFENKQYDESAVHYAQTQSSFEEISLKFLQAQQMQALRLFLKKKLELLRPSDVTQITMIVMWVLELFLNQLGELRDRKLENTLDYIELQKEFDSFLKQKPVMECVKRYSEKVYSLIASHGDKANLVKLTSVNRDFEKVIRHHLYKGHYREALEVLKSQDKKELFYEFAPALMQAEPKQTVAALISQGRALKPVNLLPALIACDLRDPKAVDEAIYYLEFAVHKLHANDHAIHNYLLMLYAKFQPTKLKRYLATEGEDVSTVHYDPHYALRLCRELKLNEACVQLSALLGLWESAVDLALTENIQQAKDIASQPQYDTELQKKLWLKIAKHVVSEKNDIQQAMEFLKQCPLVKIEDILPFFSDFVTIDHFKDAICTSLQVYNQRIQDLKDDMEEASKSAEIIRDEIHSFRKRYTVVGCTDVCEECSLQLLLRPFYLFPCGHRFHSDCLLNELLPALPPGKRNKLEEYRRQLASLTSKDDAISINSTSMSARDQLKADIDAIVASECLYCGEMMIKSIDRPFVEDEKYEQIMKEWE
ncbi:Vacuolar protein sorting-associated protein 18-like protein [Frankliniella fusca]|uniref:Vacuolar protein sorting-associated protein 18 homolog n=1 Tax=Frankliniella fusca TaxID=407009 RepID=A0AAE1I0U8_9NEOP|nr:Vacuolar protein sorting-associated protein 18-like protein [Frankliniella fusca]